MITVPRYIKVKDSMGRDTIVNLSAVQSIKTCESSDRSRQSLIVFGEGDNEHVNCAHPVSELWDMIGKALEIDR